MPQLPAVQQVQQHIVGLHLPQATIVAIKEFAHGAKVLRLWIENELKMLSSARDGYLVS